MIVLLIASFFSTCIGAGIINKDIHMIIGAGFLLLSCCIVGAAAEISQRIEGQE
jgi:hypothetical protein